MISFGDLDPWVQEKISDCLSDYPIMEAARLQNVIIHRLVYASPFGIIFPSDVIRVIITVLEEDYARIEKELGTYDN